jgi:hypothetical protein
MTGKMDLGAHHPFIHEAEGEKRVLTIAHPESGAPWDYPVSLEILAEHRDVALISMTDRRGMTDGSPNPNKYICCSLADGKRILTSYLVYTFNGPVVVNALKPELRDLFADVEMEHVDVNFDRTPRRVIVRHLERIKGTKSRITENQGLTEITRKVYEDMLNHVPLHYCIYNGLVSELPEITKAA